MERIRKRIVVFLSTQHSAVPLSTIYANIVGRRTGIKAALSGLVKDSILDCQGDGVRADPRTYRMPGRVLTKAPEKTGTLPIEQSGEEHIIV